MFAASIATNALQSSMKALSAMVEEARFEITADGIVACAVDPANASLVSLNIPKSVFTEYDATEAELGIDLARFVEILGMSEKDVEVELRLDPETHRLDISMGKLSYTMSLIDTETLRKSPQIPELNLPAEITVSTPAFKRMIKAGSMVGDNMWIGVQDDTFFMEADGDGDSVRLDLTESELVKIVPANVKTLYSLDYLEDISKGIGTSSDVVISLGRDLPLVIDFSPHDGCSMTYVLAPRIEPEG